MFLPGYYSTHHNWSVSAALAGRSEHALIDRLGVGSLRVFDPDWWLSTSSWNALINNAWLTISAILIAWAIANAWRVWRVMRLARRQNDSARPVKIDGIPIVVTDEIGPATVGLLSSSVLVPQWVLTLPAAQRQYVLRHEEEHRRAHDGLLLFVASLPLILAPWSLALWWQVRRLCLAVEMDCDSRVVRALGDPHAYGELLVRVAEAGNRGPRLQPAFLGMGMLERRLKQLLAPTRLRHLQRLIVPTLALALLALVIWMPHPISGHGSHTPGTMVSTATTHPSSH
jgi:beta-lactamase regulating signal transducer with metallopeptidase domain